MTQYDWFLPNISNSFIIAVSMKSVVKQTTKTVRTKITKKEGRKV
jgi:hypothetical protein